LLDVRSPALVQMSTPRIPVLALTAVAMLAFAGNSLLCRVALEDTSIDPASFTAFAYASLSAATGALLLFSAVQATMIGRGVWAGERPTSLQLCGIVLAFGGLIGLLLPGLSAPLTSGLGYVIWYAALPALKATQAATVQLSVPLLAALGGALLLGEHVSLRYVAASAAILSGIALVIREHRV
jgi:drug/metabolite transporter (DMT)-like permease